jgi:hypothetical protein
VQAFIALMAFNLAATLAPVSAPHTVYPATSALTQRIVDWRVAHQSGRQHGHETSAQHRQKHCDVCRHRHNKDDACQRGADHTNKKGGHPDNGESFRLNVQIWKYKLADSSEEQSIIDNRRKPGNRPEDKTKGPRWGASVGQRSNMEVCRIAEKHT